MFPYHGYGEFAGFGGYEGMGGGFGGFGDYEDLGAGFAGLGGYGGMGGGYGGMGGYGAGALGGFDLYEDDDYDGDDYFFCPLYGGLMAGGGHGSRFAGSGDGRRPRDPYESLFEGSSRQRQGDRYGNEPDDYPWPGRSFRRTGSTRRGSLFEEDRRRRHDREGTGRDRGGYADSFTDRLRGMNLGEGSGRAQMGRDRAANRSARRTTLDEAYLPDDGFFMSGVLRDDEMPFGSRRDFHNPGVSTRRRGNMASAGGNFQGDDDELADYYNRLGGMSTHGRQRETGGWYLPERQPRPY